MNPGIKIFITGGTFDKEYNELDGTLYFKDSHIKDMLKLGRCRVDFDLRTLMLIDSLDMSEADRKLILENCKSAKEEKIVITHGTDTMAETAQLLGKNLTGKTVVLTGAMVPYVFGSSDGLFNLGGASLPNMAWNYCAKSCDVFSNIFIYLLGI